MRLESYHPTEANPNLYLKFAKIEDANNVLYFVRRYGPVTIRGLEENGYDDVGIVSRHAAGMHSLVQAQSAGIDEFFDKAVNTQLHINMDFMPSIDQSSGKPKLVFLPQSFLGALWLQLGQALGGSGTAFRQCNYCGELFEAGPGTGRRLDATYCCDAHRIAFGSLKRSRRPSGLVPVAG